MLREKISEGQRRSAGGWRKILVVVEGLFSMEGMIADLPGLLRLKKKYKFYLFVDEAHSIGAPMSSWEHSPNHSVRTADTSRPTSIVCVFCCHSLLRVL